jgi:hypothetical protein
MVRKCDFAGVDGEIESGWRESRGDLKTKSE